MDWRNIKKWEPNLKFIEWLEDEIADDPDIPFGIESWFTIHLEGQRVQERV